MGQLIPRILHQIWLGGSPIPEEFLEFSAGWRRHHPHWEYRLWTDRRLPRLVHGEVIRAMGPLAGKADVLRYELIWRFGGVYVDMDFECLQSIDPLLEDIPAFIADQRVNRPINGLFGACLEHGFSAALVSGIPASFAAHDGIFHQTGPGFLRRTLRRFLGPGFRRKRHGRGVLHCPNDVHRTIQGFESSVFCPYDSHEKHRRHESFPDAYAVHHWAGSWLESGTA